MRAWSAVQWWDIVPSAQTVRRGGVGPVRSLLGGKPHRPLFCVTSLRLGFRRCLLVSDLQQFLRLRPEAEEFVVSSLLLLHPLDRLAVPTTGLVLLAQLPMGH